VKVLVTGAAGFIGAALSHALLARGDEVIGIDNLNTYYDPALKRARVEALGAVGGNRFSFETVDFSERAALDRALEPLRFARIVHLGAQAGVRHSLTDPHVYVQSNLVGHLNLLEVARQREVEHMVYASSSSVYGGNTKLPFAVEDRVDHPLSLYAATKKADELMSETYAHLYRIPLTGLRFFTVYGPWGRPDMMMWVFAEAILAGRPIPLFNEGRMWRDFTYIDDIVGGILASLDNAPADDNSIKPGGSTKPHRIYNVGNSRSEPLTRVIDLIEQECGRKAELQLLPMQPGDVEQTYADVTAISRDLGYFPATTIDEGVPRFVRWLREYRGI
jgi:UDP-glucuronate 4-epimerase